MVVAKRAGGGYTVNPRVLVGRDGFWVCDFEPWAGTSKGSGPGFVLGLVFTCNWL